MNQAQQSVRLGREVFVGVTLVMLVVHIGARWIAALFIQPFYGYDSGSLDALLRPALDTLGFLAAGWWLWRAGRLEIDRQAGRVAGRVAAGEGAAAAIWVTAAVVATGLHWLVWSGAQVFVEAAVWLLAVASGAGLGLPLGFVEYELWTVFQFLAGFALVWFGDRIGLLWAGWNRCRTEAAD